jgi:hypothetical protein
MLEIGLIIWILHFFMFFFATQRLYLIKYSYLFFLLLFSLIISVLCFTNIKYDKSDVKIFPLVLLFPIYFLVILAIKSFYKKLNDWLIKRRLIKSEFVNKEFTFVTIYATGLSIWDKKLVNKPSPLDYILSIGFLLAFPLFIVLMIFS